MLFFYSFSDLVVFCMFCRFCTLFFYGCSEYCSFVYLLVLNIVFKHKTCNCSPKHNNYLQNNKNFAHSLDIETYKYVAQHDSRARARAKCEWIETHIMSLHGHSSLSFLFHSIIANSCLSINHNRSIEISMIPTINILIREFVQWQNSRSKVQTCVWKCLSEKKQYQIRFSFK